MSLFCMARKFVFHLSSACVMLVAGDAWSYRILEHYLPHLRNVVLTPSSSHSSDSDDTEERKNRYWKLCRKYARRWRCNTARRIARRRKVALRKVSSMLQKLMRRAHPMLSPEVLHLIAEFLARRSPLHRSTVPTQTVWLL